MLQLYKFFFTNNIVLIVSRKWKPGITMYQIFLKSQVILWIIYSFTRFILNHEILAQEKEKELSKKLLTENQKTFVAQRQSSQCQDKVSFKYSKIAWFYT